METDIRLRTHKLKLKPEIVFQYGDRLYRVTGSSHISAMDWDISSKFGSGGGYISAVDTGKLWWVKFHHMHDLCM